MKAIRVILLDDHAMFSEAIRDQLNNQPDINVVKAYNAPEDALRECSPELFDVLVLDVELDGQNGLDLIPKFLEIAPAARILILSMYNHGYFVRRALDLGALGYVLKGGSIVDLIRGIQTVASGATYIPEELKESAGYGTRKFSGSLELSRRELEVLELLCRGKMLKEIGDELKISENAASTYRSRAMVKLGVNNRADLIKIALESGLVK